jgi:lipopolysaccharide export system protein LptA
MGRPGLLGLGLILALLVAGTCAWGQKEAPQAAGAAPGEQSQASGDQKAEIPLRISASQLEADQDQRRIVFTGQVKAEYGDSVLYTDKLLVFYEPEKEKRPAASPGQTGRETSPWGDLGGGKLDRLEAQGNVRFVQGDRVATGDKAVYKQSRDEIVLMGRPQVWRGENHLKGSRITFHLGSKKVVVEGSPQQRVEAHLYQAGRGLEASKEALSSGAPRAAPPSGRPR